MGAPPVALGTAFALAGGMIGGWVLLAEILRRPAPLQ
jgi:hypothetical protein